MSAIEMVSVLDDSVDDLEMTLMAVESAGYQARVLDHPSSINDALRLARECSDALICDHNLSYGAAIQFNGAALVDRCYDARFPAILVTGFMVDSGTTIRQYRRHIPQLISRSDLDGERLRVALELTEAELRNELPRERRPHESLLQVVRVNADTGQLDVIIPQWDSRVKVPLPANLLPNELVGGDLLDLEGRFLFAKINTAAESEMDLFFEDFRDAGAVPEDSELDD